MKRHEISANFLTSEFMGTGRAGRFVRATSLRAVQDIQLIRSNLKAPVVIVGTNISGEYGNRTYTVKYKCPERDIGITQRSYSWGKTDVRVYGPNASVADRVKGMIRYDFDSFLNCIGIGTFGMNNAVALMAMLQVDYREKQGNNTVYGMEMNLNNVPWCAVFYHWCVAQVKEILTVDPGFDYRFTPRYSNSRKTLDRAPVKSKRLVDALPGYALVWARTDDPVSGHTGICIHNDVENRIITLIEPNYSNKVTLRRKSYSRINRNKLEFVGTCSYFPEDIHTYAFMDKVNLAQGTYIESSGDNGSTR